MSQSILIVGGGLGIGLETSRSILAATSSGTKLVVFGLHADKELTEKLSPKYEGRLWVILGDVTSPSDRAKAIDFCISKTGSIDTLVYCAGVIGPIERIENLDIEASKKSFDVNVFGAISMSQQVLPYIRKAAQRQTNPGMGKIIILSSACDESVTYCGWMPYCVSKAALTRFIQLLAHEERNICVQGVYPKLTRTQMPADVIAGKYKGIMADEEIERFKKWSAQGDSMVEPPAWCGEAVAKLAIGQSIGGKSGEVLYYDEHVNKDAA